MKKVPTTVLFTSKEHYSILCLYCLYSSCWYSFMHLTETRSIPDHAHNSNNLPDERIHQNTKLCGNMLHPEAKLWFTQITVTLKWFASLNNIFHQNLHCTNSLSQLLAHAGLHSIENQSCIHKRSLFKVSLAHSIAILFISLVSRSITSIIIIIYIKYTYQILCIHLNTTKMLQ